MPGILVNVKASVIEKIMEKGLMDEFLKDPDEFVSRAVLFYIVESNALD